MSHHDGNSILVAWLKDAHGMEKALVPILENHAKDAIDFPQMQSRIQQHAEETENHKVMIERCLEQMGESPSATKDTLSSIFGGTQSIATGMFKDELVKNALMDFASEHFEMACYRALIVAAQDAGEMEVAQVCRQILQDEERMAQWLDQQLPMVVRTTMEMAHT